MELKDTVEMMLSDDYKERLKAEYWQTKIRLSRLRALLNKEEATRRQNYEREQEDFLGFELAANVSLIQEQLEAMEDYFHALEVRAIIEHIDID